MRLEFTVPNGHRKLAFELWVGGNFGLSEQPNLSHQAGDGVGLYIHITAAGLFQCLIVSIMNGETRMRLEFTVPSGHRKLAFELWVGAILA
eukprot:scaffold4524_cov53-Cyclotella_meneghiniana.AAC.1